MAKTSDKIHARKIQREIKKVSCDDCGAVAGEACLNKTTFEEIRGMHRARKLRAFATGLIVQNVSKVGHSGYRVWALPPVDETGGSVLD